jgi:hypothetical protein
VNLFKLSLLLSALMLITSCGSVDDTTPGTCGANVIDQGMQLSVTNLGNNTYSMELCAPATPASVFTVYASTSQSDLMPSNINMNATWRTQSIQGASKTGDKFQVVFNSFDTYFAIYQDMQTGGGIYQKDATTTLVTPHRIPGR